MLSVRTCLFLLACTTGALAVDAQLDRGAAYALIHRIVPGKADRFVIEPLPAAARDSFGISSRGTTIVLQGNNGVSIASALYFYLTEFCHCQITWNGSNLHLPSPLPL